MHDQSTVKITVTATVDGFFCNATLPSPVGKEYFACTTIQPSVEMAIASAMDHIREYANLAKFRAAQRADEQHRRLASIVDPEIPGWTDEGDSIYD